MRIFVEGLEFVGPHGVYAEERREGRRFRVDLAVEVDDTTSASTDELEDTIDYRHLSQIILDVGHGPSVSLIEHMGHEILTRVMERYTHVREAHITVRKFATGVPGEPECVGIELTRQRRA